MKAWRELAVFGAAYLLYNTGRGFTNGDMDLAISTWFYNPVFARPRLSREVVYA